MTEARSGPYAAPYQPATSLWGDRRVSPPPAPERTVVDMFTGVRRPYISGQISGLAPTDYHHNFGRAEALLMSHDLDPVNPLKVIACHDEGCNGDAAKPDGSYLHSWKCYMKYDIQSLMMDCDSIAMISNWPHSRGAKLEMHVARELHYPIFYISRGFKTVTKGVGI